MLDNKWYVVEIEQQLFKRCSENPGLYLNLGCGDRMLEGFLNIDKYTRHPDVFNDDIITIATIKDASVDVVFSAHSLEHLSIRDAYCALRRWSNVLKIGGKLYLSMPDLKLIARELLEESLTYDRYQILRFALYGYQVPNTAPRDSIEVDPSQFHYSGFCLQEMVETLQSYGIERELSIEFDGNGTPSFFVIGVRNV